MKDPEILVGVNVVTQAKCTGRGYMVSRQGGPSPPIEDVPRGHDHCLVLLAKL